MVLNGRNRLHLTEGRRDDHKGAEALAPVLPDASVLIGDRAYDSRWFRQLLNDRGITACIRTQSNRKGRPPLDRQIYRERRRIENLFARLKDWRRIHTLAVADDVELGRQAAVRAADEAG